MKGKNQKTKGKFIVICGGEGSGKSSVIEAVRGRYPDAVVTREPGGTPYAESIRDLMFKNPLAKDANAETMFGLFWAARAEHMHHLVVPSLAAGKNVVSDRGDCCTFAYQLVAQKALHLQKLFWPMRDAYLGDHAPNMYIFLDVKPEIGLKRVEGRPGKKNHFDERDIDFHKNVRKGYLDFFENLKKLSLRSSHCIVDVGKPLEEVVGEVLNIIGDTFE